MAVGAAALLVFLVALPSLVSLKETKLIDSLGRADLRIVTQLAVLCVAGLSMPALAVWDVVRRKDADSVLLFLWTMATFIFASFINWGMNGRSILQTGKGSLTPKWASIYNAVRGERCFRD